MSQLSMTHDYELSIDSWAQKRRPVLTSTSRNKTKTPPQPAQEAACDNIQKSALFDTSKAFELYARRSAPVWFALEFVHRAVGFVPGGAQAEDPREFPRQKRRDDAVVGAGSCLEGHPAHVLGHEIEPIFGGRCRKQTFDDRVRRVRNESALAPAVS